MSTIYNWDINRDCDCESDAMREGKKAIVIAMMNLIGISNCDINRGTNLNIIGMVSVIVLMKKLVSD